MFLPSSRYAKTPTATVTAADGREVVIIRRRTLDSLQGVSVTVKQPDRLDVMALRRYSSPTGFWHIADANSELWAEDLLAEPGRVISAPEH